MVNRNILLLVVVVLLVVAVEGVFGQEVQNLRVVDAGNTWFTVKFDTPIATDVTVFYSTSFYTFGNSAYSGTITTSHTITVNNLNPDTLYYFNILFSGNTDDNDGKHYRFVTNIGNGNTYFMSNEGDDINDGSYDSPFRTLNYAKDQLNPGDTLLIMDGIYTGFGENVCIDFRDSDGNSGTLDNPITYRAYNAGYGMHPIFDGQFNDMYGGPSGANYIFFIFGAKNIVFDSLWVRNIDHETSTGEEVSGFRVLYKSSDNIAFRNCYASSLMPWG